MSAEENTYEQYSTTHPGAVDVVENATGKILRSYYPDTGKDVSADDETFAGVDKEALSLPEPQAKKRRKQRTNRG